MADYISREAAISEILSEPTDAHYPSWYAEKLKQIPAADVRPVVHGHWESSLWFVTCSVCEYTSADTDDEGSEIALNFCPNCGADMREPNLDTTKGDGHD